jgi:hypothetical protein
MSSTADTGVPLAGPIADLSEDQLQVLCHIADSWAGMTGVEEATACHFSRLGLASVTLDTVQTTALGQHLLAVALTERLDNQERLLLRRISNGGARAARFVARDIGRLFDYHLITKAERSLVATPLGKQCALLLEKSPDIGIGGR